MRELSEKGVRRSTRTRYEMVMAAYSSLKEAAGEYGNLVPRGWVYERLSEQPGLCTKTVAWVLNHWKG